MVREFKLINNKKQEFSLMDIEKYCLLTEPTGLGYSYSTSYEQLANVFVTNLRQLEQGVISGIANFNSYDNYKKLVDFIEQSEGLKILYRIPFENSTIDYYRDIEIQSSSKTQKQTDGIIKETLTFNCLNLWYEENTTIYRTEALSNELRWNFKWNGIFNDNSNKSFEYKNCGHINAPLTLEIDGAVSNVAICVYVGKTLIQEVKIKTSILKNEKLFYSSKENEFSIKKIKEDQTEEDLFDLDVIDFENNNVVSIPKNQTCEIKLKADTAIENAKITIFPQYKCV